MIYFTVNEILHEVGSDRYYRILWIDEEYTSSYIINVKDKNALPIEYPISLLDEYVEKRLWEKEKNDLFIIYKKPRNEEQQRLRDELWGILYPLITAEPEIYKSDTRGKLLKGAIKESKMTKPRIYRLLRKYWQNGMNPNAILPNYERGKRDHTEIEYKSKTGRPRKDGNTGISVNKDILEIIKKAGKKYYLNNNKATMLYAYEMMIKEHFSEYEYYDNGILKKAIQNPNQIPTIRQFRYHLKKLFSSEFTIKKRKGNKKFEREYREKQDLS
ncbi:hypothetical protein WAX78_00620 [Bacillus sp. FJAT-53711]|uniref:Uncharacterized protein n=1 Tax=Bacillus yunxiaonensis TaxID=3127665 RepID=A0ABU8FPT0_9BACI